MEFKDYYQVLGIARGASADEIKTAFRRLARKYHPDISREPDAEARMKEINEAHSVLSDPEKRTAYDRLGAGFRAGQEFTPPPGWNGESAAGGAGFSDRDAADFSEFFSELFGRHARRGAGSGEQFHMRGDDRHAVMHLDIEDAYRETSRVITLRAPQLNEKGQVSMVERSIEVRIPKGVREGQVVRVSGQGGPGMGGGPPGDLFIQIQFNPHRHYRVDGRDIHVRLPVAPWEALLGAKVRVKLPDGALEVGIPEGSQSGRKLRLKGRGIPGSHPGDAYLTLEVVLPPVDDKARELFRTMERELKFNPRERVEA